MYTRVWALERFAYNLQAQCIYSATSNYEVTSWIKYTVDF